MLYDFATVGSVCQRYKLVEGIDFITVKLHLLSQACTHDNAAYFD